MRFQLLLICTWIFSYSANSQSLILKGSLRDAEKGELLAGVSISSGPFTGLSGADGSFSIQVDSNSYRLRFTYIGFDTLWLQLNPTKIRNGLPLQKLLMYPSGLQLRQVVVSAGKYEQRLDEVTVSMEVLKPALLENTNSTRLDQAMEQLPGVNVVNGQLNIRGGSGFSYGAGSRVIALLDGLPLLSADAADIKWDALPLENLEQVEVIKGASSALFGSGALGGVINLRTASPGSKPQTKIRVFSGLFDDPSKSTYKYWSRNPMQYGASFFHSRKLGPYELSTGFYYLQDEGYRKEENTETFRVNMNNCWRNQKIKGLSYGLNLNAIFTSGGNFLFWQDEKNPYLPAPNTLSKIQNNKYNADPFISYVSSNGSKHSLRSRIFITDNQNNTQQGSTAYSFFKEYQYQKLLSLGELYHVNITTGICHTNSRVESDSLYGSHRGENLALYAQFDQKIGRLHVSFGTRFERNKVDTIKTEYYPVFRGGVNLQTGKATFLRASLGQGYRFASLAERFAATTAGTLKIFPNPAVTPETGWSAELGVRQGFTAGAWRAYADAAAFWTEYYNMIDFTFGLYLPPVYDPNNTAQYLGFSAVNTTNARISGIELSGGAEGRLWGLPLSIITGYTFIQPLNKDYVKQATDTLGDEDKLKYRFQHSFKLNADLSIRKFDIGFSYRYNSYMLNIDPTLGIFINGVNKYRQEHEKGYALLDTRLALRLNKLHKIAILVKNTLNREYMYFPGNMGAPRSFHIQYQLSF